MLRRPIGAGGARAKNALLPATSFA